MREGRDRRRDRGRRGDGRLLDGHAAAGRERFWTPLNLIAHTFWRAATLDGRFSAPALVIGAAMHMTMAMLFGTLIAAAAFRLPAARSLVIAGGMLFAALLWTVMQYGIWRAIDAAAARDFTPWVFAVAHLLFGMVAAMFAAIVVPDADAPPRHALPRQPAGPRNWLPRPRGAGASQSAAGSELSSGRADAGDQARQARSGLSAPPGESSEALASLGWCI
jgi:hypothetical protein